MVNSSLEKPTKDYYTKAIASLASTRKTEGNEKDDQTS